jgi:hypothetical protein
MDQLGTSRRVRRDGVQQQMLHSWLRSCQRAALVCMFLRLTTHFTHVLQEDYVGQLTSLAFV